MNETSNTLPDLIVPPVLQKGDTIGLVAPAGPLHDEENFNAGVRLLREMGFKVKLAGNIMKKKGYLAGSDVERAQEFERLWLDQEVKALLAVRGGYGTLRLLPLLNIDIYRRHPKIFVGFSDITVLLSALLKKAGLVTFHGPMLTTLPRTDQESMRSFFETLTRLEPPPAIRSKNLEILLGGNAKGRLMGGNLAGLTHLIGTPYDLSWESCILFLEDINEAPYRIDRLLTQLQLAGKLEKIKGLLLGTFKDCGDPEPIWERVLNLTNGRIPVWGNFPTGHTERNRILPIGVEAEMDGTTGSLKILAPAVALYSEK